MSHERQAAEEVRAAGALPGTRLAFAAAFYRDGRRAYGRAELSFLRWAIARGVLGNETGSPWWRAVNDRLLRDKTEADLNARSPRASAPSGRPVELWGEFIAAPSPARWYRAHNASVVAGYLENAALAEDELIAERFMMNVALMRVLYTHALVAEPRLALGAFAPLGRRLGDPRLGSVKLFLDLRRSFPEGYPLTGQPIEGIIAREGSIPRLVDYGVIGSRVDALYAWAASSLGIPEVAALADDGALVYAWPPERRRLWLNGSADRLLPKLTALATRPR
ncbi:MULTISPECIES: hypothetical protein [Actinomadura]|uniref:Uncharacterized protein n=1 Tax=Actinomadura yumaensis TaxID=111807 RepID=A0ABW2CWV7_9ACTN|nr:hypothetical protein [Actinomadura sp. J1-007]MWK36327.1 hypothetical protein [Actinomadura sp. J1-007]